MFSKLEELFKKQKPTTRGPITHLVVGLGNPGGEYENTRHNIGFLTLDYILDQVGVKLRKLRFNALCDDGVLGGRRVLFMKPQTYMNKSGEAVIQAMQYYKIPPENIVVICDDVTQSLGTIRIRRKGGHGGQNGLKNIVALAGEDFPRVRLGIDPKPHPQMDLADWVISKFSPDELKSLAEIYPSVYKATELIVAGDIDNAMNRYNLTK